MKKWTSEEAQAEFIRLSEEYPKTSPEDRINESPTDPISKHRIIQAAYIAIEAYRNDHAHARKVVLKAGEVDDDVLKTTQSLYVLRAKFDMLMNRILELPEL